MKTPLKFQITEYDYGTVSLLNAFSYLFDREKIPALLVKQVYKFMLDCYDENDNIGNGGTSKDATKKITSLITKYTKENNFCVTCERLTSHDINYENINLCLKK